MADLVIFLRAYAAGLVGFLVFTGTPFSASTAVPPDPLAIERPAAGADAALSIATTRSDRR
jgi:hypothetical protein